MISNILDDYLDYLSSTKERADTTIREYYYDLRAFLRYMRVRKEGIDIDKFEEISIDEVDVEYLKEITKQDIYSYSSYLDKKRNNSSRTKFRKLSSVRSFFNYLAEKIEVLEKNPAENLDMPKIEKSLPVYLTLEESVQLLNSVQASKQKEIYKKRDYAIILLFLNCGLRLSELNAMNISDIEKNYTVRIIGKGSKERIIYLNESCRDAIQSYLKLRKEKSIENEALFLSMRENRMSNRSIQHMIEKHLKNAGFDTKKYSVHKLRHTAATLMYQYGDEDIKSLQEILGHESISTTQIYTHVDQQDIRHVMNKNPLGNISQLESMKNVDINNKEDVD